MDLIKAIYVCVFVVQTIFVLDDMLHNILIDKQVYCVVSKNISHTYKYLLRKQVSTFFHLI